jgi:hypothetical protein
LSDIISREVLFEGDKVQLTTVQKINTEKTELKETKSKSAALLKHSGDCVMQFLKKKVFLPMSSLVMLLYAKWKQ